MHRHQARAFTLAELIMSMAVMSVLGAAAASAMVLASRAIPDASSPLSATLAAGAVQADMAADLRYAINFTEISERAIDFRVPDRNHGLPGAERIRYEWSGTTSESLYRSYNGGTAVPVAENVQEFKLTYHVESVQTSQDTESESGETTLISYTASTTSDYVVDSNHWVGAYFRPQLAANSVSWKVTKVRVRARAKGLNLGSTAVQLRAATSDHRPDINVLDEATMSELGLTYSYLWQTFSFSKVPDINPKQGLCLVLKHISDSDSCEVEWQDKGLLSPVTHRVDTGTAGGSWSVDVDRTMSLVVLGTVKTKGDPVVVTTEHLEAVGIKLRLGDTAETRVDTSIQLLNRPEVTGL